MDAPIGVKGFSLDRVVSLGLRVLVDGRAVLQYLVVDIYTWTLVYLHLTCHLESGIIS